MNTTVLVLFVATFLFVPKLTRIATALVAQFVLLLATTPRRQGIGARHSVKNARRWRELYKLVSLAHFLGIGFSPFIVERKNMPCTVHRLFSLGGLACF
jgi:hypothetical protein